MPTVAKILIAGGSENVNDVVEDERRERGVIFFIYIAFRIGDTYLDASFIYNEKKNTRMWETSSSVWIPN